MMRTYQVVRLTLARRAKTFYRRRIMFKGDLRACNVYREDKSNLGNVIYITEMVPTLAPRQEVHP